MSKCFVIQPFDGGAFDSRFDDVLAPAIKDAGLIPYRVDRDPASVIPIEDISAGISNSVACLCDITTDNPNVWFELGYAIASQKDVVLICSKSRTNKFPFDVQHRTVVTYQTESPRDFTELKNKITPRLKAIIERHESLGQIAHLTPTTLVQGLDQHEMATLIAVAQRLDVPDDGVLPYRVREDMEAAGFTKLATTMGIRSLLQKQMLNTTTVRDEEGNTYTGYGVTSGGREWLHDNKDKVVLRQDPGQARPARW